MRRERLPLAVDNRVVLVPIDDLLLDGSPRSAAENPEHLRLLAAAEDKLPPVLVHRETMRVIDGRHRVGAARMRGERYVEARFFTGDEAYAFVLAVSSNLTHGLPLPIADRKVAAARIVTSHPQWSDRTIASVTGLSARTVAEVRAGLGEQCAGAARVGRDGRSRPVNGADRRKAAAEVMEREPDLSLRQVAQRVGISPETARDVRKRMLRGASPVPQRSQDNERGQDSERNPKYEPRAPAETPEPPAVRAVLLNRLRAEPGLLESPDGRALLRLLLMHSAETANWERMATGIPAHRSAAVVELALASSRLWTEFADRVERGAAVGDHS